MGRFAGYGLVFIALLGCLVVPAGSTLALDTGRVRAVSVSPDGEIGNGGSDDADVSADGRYVAFASAAWNLVESDAEDRVTHIFIRDLVKQETFLVSLTSTGEKATSSSHSPSISADGRYVAFVSFASNLVDGDTNEDWDVFVRDRQLGETTRVSVHSDGTEADADSNDPDISRDGRYVAFQSVATNLVDDDTNNSQDVFVHDRSTGETERVSVKEDGTETTGSSLTASISGDGRYVAFMCTSDALAPGDSNGYRDVVLRDRETQENFVVSLADDGSQGNYRSYQPSISSDGRYVAFSSGATNLVDGDTNAQWDVFVRDRQAETTVRVSVSSSGEQADESCTTPAISPDGRYVAFHSRATTLNPGHTGDSIDVFLHDTSSGNTVLVSKSQTGGSGNGTSQNAAMGAKRIVAFESTATNLVADDTNGVSDVFQAGSSSRAFVPALPLLLDED